MPARTTAWLAALAGPITIAVTGVAMLAWTWRTWPDPIVDYGREIYAAWQVASGRTLYADFVHFCGPLSVYLNALCFRLFGTSLLTLALWNAALTAGFVAVLYRLLVRVSTRFAATAACVVFVTLFAFGRFTRIGNYNWLCPYSHELVHGAMLAIVSLAALARYADTHRPAWMAGSGLALGLLALTKVEPLVAGAPAIAVGLVLTLVAEGASARRAAMLLAAFIGGAAVAPAIALAWFAGRMPLDEVLQWPLGHWTVAVRPELASNPFYRSGMGMDDVAGNLRTLATASFWYVLVVGAVVAAAVRLRGRRGSTAMWAGIAVASAALFGGPLSIDAWATAARPLPLLMALVVGALVVDFVRRRADRGQAPMLAIRTALAVFALLLLAKMALNARVFHYGFVLAMPAVVVLVVALLEWLPAAVERRGGQGALVRAVMLGAIVAAVSSHLLFMRRLLAPMVHVVAEGGDAFYADAQGLLVNQVLREIRTRTAPTDTLVVLPEGIMVNFLARRRNPTPFYVRDGTSRLLWGEERMARSLADASPDWIVLLDRGNRSTPTSAFGRNRYRDEYAWIQASYVPVAQLGAAPFRDARAGATLMRRGAPPSPR